MELIDDLNTCIDEKYFPQDHLEQLKEEGYTVNKMLNGYIAYLQKRKNETPGWTLQRSRPIKPINLINPSTQSTKNTQVNEINLIYPVKYRQISVAHLTGINQNT